LPVAGLCVRLCCRSIRLRFEQRHGQRRWDQHSSVDPDAAHYCAGDCYRNGNVWDGGFDSDGNPHTDDDAIATDHDAVAEEWLILCKSARCSVTIGIHKQVTCVMKIGCHFWTR
jgi:hypothetical protein